MLEATSSEVAFLVSATPTSGRRRGRGTGDGGGVVSGPVAVLSLACVGFFFGNLE